MKNLLAIIRWRLPHIRLSRSRAGSAVGRKKSILLLAGCILLSGLLSTAQAQDIIVLKDGTLVHSKVCEVTPTEIKYRKLSNQNGPLYTIEKSSVLAINYQNGEKETYAETPALQSPAPAQSAAPSPSAPREVAVAPADDNEALCAKYNKPTNFFVKETRSLASCATYKYGITKSSVLSNQDLEISIDFIGAYPDHYAIKLTNKTDRTIYVDLGNTFRVDREGENRIYFEGSEQTTISHGSARGGSIGLGSVASALGIGGTVGTLAGGVTVGGGKQHGVSTTYVNQRILVIPPHGKEYLAKHKEMEVRPGGPLSSREVKTVSRGEWFHPNKATFFTKKGCILEGAVRQFTEDNSPDEKKYALTYSMDETFSTYSVVRFGVFLQQVCGGACMRLYTNSPLCASLDRIIKDMRKYFDYNSYCIMGQLRLAK